MAPVDLIDLHPALADLRAEALAGLTAARKTLDCKLFYDQRGAELFEAICELPEYYLTRTELGILREHLPAMAGVIGPHAQVYEPGSGAGTKTRLLLDALEDPVAYVGIDISREHLRAMAAHLQQDYPAIEIQAICADFQQAIPPVDPARAAARRVVFFPGSTIGNFDPADAGAFLGRMADLAGPGGGLLIGFDRVKDPEVLVAAYDDAQGVTAAFNKNALVRLNDEAGADFDLEAFEHVARWDAGKRRIEMHLRSRVEQTVRLGDASIHFEAGETIHTESCHKYGPDGVAPLTDRFDPVQTWTDPDERFGVQFLTVRG